MGLTQTTAERVGVWFRKSVRAVVNNQAFLAGDNFSTLQAKYGLKDPVDTLLRLAEAKQKSLTAKASAFPDVTTQPAAMQYSQTRNCAHWLQGEGPA